MTAPAHRDAARIVVPVRAHHAVPVRYEQQAVGTRRQLARFRFEVRERSRHGVRFATEPLSGEPGQDEGAALQVGLQKIGAGRGAIQRAKCAVDPVLVRQHARDDGGAEVQISAAGCDDSGPGQA
jgi:hypothetical protein